MSTGSTGKAGFDEGFASPALDALDGRSADFDWDELMRRLGEFSDQDIGEAGEALGILVAWIVAPSPKSRFCEATIARRCLVAAWALNPGLIDGSPSLTRLARQVGIHKVILSRHAAAFSKRFGIRNRAQVAHDWRPGKKGGGHE